MKTISINCKGNRYINYKDLKNFQGNLKELTKERCDKLKSEILKLGWIAPVFIWNENEILDGHQRIFALNELIKDGCTIDNIPIVDIDAKTKKDAAKILLALNSRYGQITDEGLYEFMNLMALQVEDLEGIELADIDMDRFIEGNYKQEGLTDPDEVPEVPEETITKLGDLYTLGSHRLLCGDSTKKENVEKLMDGKKADMVFTSPPYNGNNTVGGGNIFTTKSQKLYKNDKDNMSTNDYIKFTKIVLDMCFVFTKGFIFWNVSYNANSRYEYIKQTEDRLEYLVEQICWKKTSAIPNRGCMRRTWEPIYIFSTSKRPLGLNKVYSNLWDISNLNSQTETHKACFPVALPMEAIKILPKTKIVLDLFLGSGSTLIAAEKTGRICYGQELDCHYVDICIERWCRYTGIIDIKRNGKDYKWILKDNK